MSFVAILEDLVNSVPNARGAVFVDDEGEYVEFFSKDAGEQMKLAGAHQGVVLSMFAEAGAAAGAGAPKVLYVQNADVDLFTKMLKDGYFVLLATERGGLPASAMRQLSLAAAKIEAEI